MKKKKEKEGIWSVQGKGKGIKQGIGKKRNREKKGIGKKGIGKKGKGKPSDSTCLFIHDKDFSHLSSLPTALLSLPENYQSTTAPLSLFITSKI